MRVRPGCSGSNGGHHRPSVGSEPTVCGFGGFGGFNSARFDLASGGLRDRFEVAGIKPAKPAKPAPIGFADGLDPVFSTAPAGPGEEPEPEDDPALAELKDATDTLGAGERAFAADVGQRLRQRLLARGSVVVRTCPRGALACLPCREPAAREDFVERLQQGKEALLLGIAALSAADEVERIAEFARRDLRRRSSRPSGGRDRPRPRSSPCGLRRAPRPSSATRGSAPARRRRAPCGGRARSRAGRGRTGARKGHRFRGRSGS